MKAAAIIILYSCYFPIGEYSSLSILFRQCRKWQNLNKERQIQFLSCRFYYVLLLYYVFYRGRFTPSSAKIYLEREVRKLLSLTVSNQNIQIHIFYPRNKLQAVCSLPPLTILFSRDLFNSDILFYSPASLFIFAARFVGNFVFNFAVSFNKKVKILNLFAMRPCCLF